MLTLSMRLDLRKGMCTMHREMHLVVQPPRLVLDALRRDMRPASLQ